MADDGELNTNPPTSARGRPPSPRLAPRPVGDVAALVVVVVVQEYAVVLLDEHHPRGFSSHDPT